MKTSPESDPRTQDLIGVLVAERYRITELIAEGAMGRVFLAEHVMMRKPVALKLLRHELTRVASVVSRFEREAMAAAHIEHQNIAAATDFGKLDDGSVFLVLEYIEGRNLREAIDEGPVALGRVLHIGRQIAAALAAAHAKDIVHRDLKPENIMLLERRGDLDFIKVLDFGIAKVPIEVVGEAEPGSGPITKAGMVFGTPDYMAPEQALGQEVDARADLYSLGVILYEMLAGVRPFQGGRDLGVLGQQLMESVPPVSERAPSVAIPETVDRYLKSLLAKERSARLQSAREALRGLDALISDQARENASGELSGSVKALWVDEQTDPKLPQTAPSLVAPPGKRSSLRERLSSVPALVRYGVPAALLVFSAGVVWNGLGARQTDEREGDSPVSSAPAASNVAPSPSVAPSGSAQTGRRAPDSEIEAALARGVEGIEALSTRYPDDERVALALAEARVEAKQYAAALAALEAAVESKSELGAERRVSRLVWTLAQVDATRSGAFTLMKSKLGERGAELVFDLFVNDDVRSSVEEEATRWMHTRSFQRVASPDVAVAAELALAKSCSQRQALLRRAKNVGGKRALVQLDRMSAESYCAKDEPDCLACLAKGDMASTGAAIRQRLEAQPSRER